MKLINIYRLIYYNKVSIWQLISIPFVILHLRYIQWKYKYITINNNGNQTSSNLARLGILQAWEEYYKKQFDSWGKYHYRFSYEDKTNKIHKDNMKWLFPEKNFKEWDIIIWHCYEAVTYYHNKIYRLNNDVSTHYSTDIKKQIKEWNKEK